MRKILKWFGIGVGTLLLVSISLLLIAAVVGGLLYRFKPPVHSARYLTMSDGTRVAADVWLPKDLKAGARVPVLVAGTPYWRGASFTFLGDALAEYGLLRLKDPTIVPLNARGYAVVMADARGTGASFGHQDVMFSPREIADFGEVIAWAAKQGWSNGKVGAYGFSYRGVLADDMASLGEPALKAIAPSFDFPDGYLVLNPGGVFSDPFLRAWGTQTKGLNNEGRYPCGSICAFLIAGPERVDADTDGALVRAAIAGHAKNYDVYACVKAAPYRDSPICKSGLSLGAVSEYARKAAIEKSGVPMLVFAGWFDANSADQVLHRFDDFSNPQDVTVAAISHGGFLSTDPYAAANAAADPSYRTQLDETADFFDRALKDGGAPVTGKTLHFKVLNGGWKTAHSWPPAGVAAVDWYPAPGHVLASAAPERAGEERYKVDFTATTGTVSRYRSPVDLSETAYPDRAAQDKKLLTYTSTPLDADVTLAGNPVARLMLSSSTADGEAIVYLEDVAPTGKVTYLTEGVLRLSDRKLAAAGGASADPYHSFLKADSQDMPVDGATPVQIELAPIAARIAKGHRIRIAIASADADNLARIPAQGDVTFGLEYGQSSIELPVMAGN